MHYPGHVQFEWFAIDSRGYVAVLNANGRGPIPAPILDFAGEVYERLQLAFLELPRVSQAVRVPSGITYDGEFHEIAERGLFAYDYTEPHRRVPHHAYEMQARPLEPRLLTELNLPEDLMAMVMTLDCEGLLFESATEIRTSPEWTRWPGESYSAPAGADGAEGRSVGERRHSARGAFST